MGKKIYIVLLSPYPLPIGKDTGFFSNAEKRLALLAGEVGEQATYLDLEPFC
jgi:hypothetical protein